MMPSRPVDNFGLRLAVFYGCLFSIMGLQLPFFPLWLKSRGLDPQAIGFVLAVPIVMRIFAVPVINRMIDRSGNIRGGLIAAAFASAFGFSIVGISYGFSAIVLAFALAALFAAPIMSLTDAYALKGLNARKRAYGPIRLWGSAAFIATNIGGDCCSLLSRSTIWSGWSRVVLAGCGWRGFIHSRRSRLRRLNQKRRRSPLAVAAIPDRRGRRPDPGEPRDILRLFRRGWTAKGIGSMTVGALWGLGVTVELALFAISGRLRLSAIAFVAIGAAGAMIRWIAMSFDPPLLALAFIQCLHGLSFGATHLGAIQFVARAAGDKQAAAAQGDFSTILAIVSAVAAVSGCFTMHLATKVTQSWQSWRAGRSLSVPARQAGANH